MDTPNYRILQDGWLVQGYRSLRVARRDADAFARDADEIAVVDVTGRVVYRPGRGVVPTSSHNKGLDRNPAS